MSLMDELNRKAVALGVPLSVQLDLTWRCNERCVHCYLDHEGADEMTTDEFKSVLRQLADCGTLFLSISGGEPLLRRDCFEILEFARQLRFNVKLKTNAVMIGEAEAVRLRQIGVEQVQVSIYSARAEVHDAITKLPGSLRRTVAAIRRMREHGLKVSVANVLMRQNAADAMAVRQLAEELGAGYAVDPTITPKLNGDASIVQLRILPETLTEVFHTEEFVGSVQEFCAPPAKVDDEVLDSHGCSAGHSAAYVSPSGEVFPCVQFPMSCGNVRTQSFREIWRQSAALAELRSIRGRDLTVCPSCSHFASCTRCPGLAYMEGNMRGPSSADCEKSRARTAEAIGRPAIAGD